MIYSSQGYEGRKLLCEKWLSFPSVEMAATVTIRKKLSEKNIEYLDIVNGIVGLECEILGESNQWGKK